MDKKLSGKYQFAIDRGGTFTDIFARCPDGEIIVHKLLSEYPSQYKDAPTEGIRRIIEQELIMAGRSALDISKSLDTTHMSEHSRMRQLEALQMRRQVEVLATFLPNEMFNFDEKTRTFVGVLLFADVSGFTPLTEKYNKTGKGGIYHLTATLNAYIGAIVEVIHFFQGDILKFSGDAFLALWKVKQGECVYDVLHGVVVCALIIQKNLGIFETEVNVQLKVKLAISCGNVSFAIIGTETTKGYVIVGDAVYDAKNAEHVSQSGDVVISPAAWSHMLHDRYEVTPAEGGNTKIWATIYKKHEEGKRVLDEKKALKVLEVVSQHLEHRRSMHSKQNFASNYRMTLIMETFLKNLPVRQQIKEAAKHFVSDDLRPYVIKPVQDQVDENEPVEYLTEMREITIQFINIVPISYNVLDLIKLSHESFKIVSEIISAELGFVNKVSLFDKDCMILVLFGLAGIRHEMESQHALRSAYRIRNMISNNVKNVTSCSIAITQGLVYCGVVGHPFRKEFTVIGTEVNKAARMMCGFPSKITCDYKTFKDSKLSSFYFQLQPAIHLKGIEDTGFIYEYNEDSNDRNIKASQPYKILGRSREYNLMREVIYNNQNTEGKYSGICFYGPKKIGKTAVLLQTITALNEVDDCHTVVSIELNTSSMVPYFSINKLYDKLYDKLGRIDRDNSVLSFLPRSLYNLREELQFPTEDVALFKYNILNTFRKIIDCNYEQSTIIFIDNFEYIDHQSWEILDIVMHERSIKLFLTTLCENEDIPALEQIQGLAHLKMVELKPISSKYVAPLVCMMIDAAGIPHQLVYLLSASCEGRPGYIQSSILRLINNGSLVLKLINKSEMNREKFVFPLEISETSDIISILEFSNRYKYIGQELTLKDISMDLFDSFTPYEQSIIKTCSVLGETFSRAMLIIAMQYPPEYQVAMVIGQLFEEDVFECGSRYIDVADIDTGKICCTCYFTETERAEELSLPRYAYCKLIHFKNRSIRDVAYELLPGNQRKELHLLCAEMIETATHTCPVCTTQPITNVISIMKFQDFMDFCTTPNKIYQTNPLAYGDYGNMRAVVKQAMNVSHISKAKSGSTIERPHYDSTKCRCFEIWVRVLKSLIYHSEQSKHLCKLVFFTMKYGQLLLLIRDYVNAIRYLREGIELCLIDADLTKGDAVMDRFKRLATGRIEIGLSQAHLALGQIQVAKNHMIVALRQYYIPSLALEYHVFNELIKRSFVVNIKRMYKEAYHCTLFRYDCGFALAHCAKIFALEGRWAMAKFAALNSWQHLRAVVPNASLLLEVYCNVIELYSYSDKDNMLEKLQKFVFKEVVAHFVSGDIDNINAIVTLMETLLESYFVRGSIMEGIRVGYKLLDVCLRTDFFCVECRLFLHLPYLLIFNGRIRDAGDVLQILHKHIHSMNKICECYYFISCLLIHLSTGFYVEELETIINFASDVKLTMAKSKRVYELLFTLIQLHFLRLGKFNRALEWKCEIQWTAHLIKQDVPMKCLLFHLESAILTYITNFYKRNANIDGEVKRINKLLSLFRDQCKAQYQLFYPFYLYYKAWMLRFSNHNRKARKVLKRMNVCLKKENILLQCYYHAALNAWKGGYSIKYEQRPLVKYSDAENYTITELCQFVHVFPLQ